MLPLYLLCLIVGGGLLLFSVLGAGEGGGDSHDPTADADVGAPEGVDVGSDAWIGARDFVSVRALVYFLAGFGATGALLEALSAASTASIMLSATATGLMAAAAAVVVYGWLQRSESGLVPTDPGHLVGVPARVLVPVQPGQRGKIVALYQGREIELLARLHSPEDAACLRGSEVVIVEIDEGTALITPFPSLPPGSLLE